MCCESWESSRQLSYPSFSLWLLSQSSCNSGPVRLIAAIWKPWSNVKGEYNDHWQKVTSDDAIVAQTSLCAAYCQVFSTPWTLKLAINSPYCLFPTLNNIITCISTLLQSFIEDTVHIVWNSQTQEEIFRSVTWTPFIHISVEFSMMLCAIYGNLGNMTWI